VKTIEDIIKIIQTQKPMLMKKHKISEIGIFGSYIRGEQNHHSDIDILINFDVFPGLIEFIGIENTLSDYLGVKVDLVTKSGLKPEISKYILSEVMYL
jgi:hypothetical protein